MEDQTLTKLWDSSWAQEVHKTDFALKRISSAKSAKMTPVLIDTTDFYGYFQGSHGRYETFLDHCPCGDFRRYKLPCKHIYRLAIELGLMDVDVKHDEHSIPTPRNECVPLDETIDLVETLSVNAQRELLRIARRIRSTHPLEETRSDNDNVRELLNIGIIVEPNPKMRTLLFGTKDQIMDLLDGENISYKRSAKKIELVELCKEYIPEKVKQRFGERVQIAIPSKYSSVKIHQYLHRKFDDQSFYNYDEGAENIIFSPVPLLETDLPDDDVTNQLIKHGYYSRK